MVANIGGAKAYKNVNAYLLELRDYTDIPDFLIIQEPGSDENFKSEILEPFFTNYKTFGKLRIHYHANIDIVNLKEVTNIDGCSFELTVKRQSRTNGYCYWCISKSQYKKRNFLQNFGQTFNEKT